MVYFQEQLSLLSETGPVQTPATADPLGFENNQIGRRAAPTQVSGLLLAVSIGSWALGQAASSGTAGNLLPSLASTAAHAVPQLLLSGLADVHLENEVPSNHESHQERRRRGHTPENKVEEELLSVQMYLAAGKLTEALEAMDNIATLITELPADAAMEQFEVFCDVADELLREVCQQNPGQEALRQAAKLAKIVGASELGERIDLLIENS